jgi:hypothetical protein
MAGYELHNPILAILERPTGFVNSSIAVRDRWTPTNQQTNTPRAGYTTLILSGNQHRQSTRSISSGNHVRLTEVLLSYRLPTTWALTVFGGGRNVLVATKYRGYDPNVSTGGARPTEAGHDNGAYPVPRTLLLGVQASL